MGWEGIRGGWWDMGGEQRQVGEGRRLEREGKGIGNRG